MDTEDEYVCTLDEATQKVALEQLNDDPNERQGHIDTFRMWIKQQKHITAPLDSQFLLKFLRKGKFSQLRAREHLESYLKAKTKYPEWLEDIDIADPKLREFIATGYMVTIPKRDKDNRTILFMDAGRFDPDKKKFSRVDVLRAIFGLGFANMQTEASVINGSIFIQDLSHFSTKLLTFWGTDMLKKTTKIFQDSIPSRPKAFHYYNPGPVFETIMTIVKPFMKKKFLDRMRFHGKNLESLYKDVAMELMPREYLPDDYSGQCQGTYQELIDAQLKRLENPKLRERVLHETSSRWRYDFKLKPEDVPKESFKKLNID